MTSGGHPAHAGLARELSEFARELQAERDTGAVLRRIVEVTVDELGAAVAAGITFVQRGRFSTVAQTHEVVTAIDEVQYRLGEGPCLTSLREEVTVRSDDLTSETRWPRYASEACSHGLRSLLSFQLFVETDNLGALNVYADKPDAFDDEDESVGVLLASHAAIAVSDKRVEGNLRRALESRDVIGQAKGILMERFKISADQAFEMLVAVSQHRHVKLRDLAFELATTGELSDTR